MSGSTTVQGRLWKGSAAVWNIFEILLLILQKVPFKTNLLCLFEIVAESLWRRRRSRVFLGSCSDYMMICRPPSLQVGSRSLSSCSWQPSVSGVRGMHVCRTLATRMWSGTEQDTSDGEVFPICPILLMNGDHVGETTSIYILNL